MGNNQSEFVRPILFGINVEKDFFSHNIFENVNLYRVKYEHYTIYVGKQVITELNAQHPSLEIVEGGTNIMKVMVKLNIDTVMKWFVYLVLNNKVLSFKTKSEFLKSNLEVFQVKLAKIGHTIKLMDDNETYVIEQIKN